MNKTWLAMLGLLALVGLALLASCSKKTGEEQSSSPTSESKPPAASTPIDPATHNIHPTPKDNREWNESQPPNAAPIQKSFAREEIMLPVKCNQHPWMKMYISVVKSPFHAVTGTDGKYEIKGLPPGDYTLAFVHEK